MLAAALVLALVEVPHATAAPSAVAPATQNRTTQNRTTTLITGDRVTTDDAGTPTTIEPGAGRTGIPITTYVSDGHQFVVPADAQPLLAADRVDRRLFDLTTLLDAGYDDASTDTIPLLAPSQDVGFSAAATSTRKVDATAFWAGLVHERPSAAARAKVWLNGKAKPTLEQSVPHIGAPAAWQSGFDGKGVTVAVLDTGYDAGHPDLAGAVSTSKDFTGSPTGVQDVDGHGTHVASITAGRGTASGGRYTGVAKQASLAIGKVCGQRGCLESEVIAGMEWASREVGARVVNMSLGGDQSDGSDPLSQAVNRLTAETGTLFVVAAGNSGVYRKVSNPASADAALAVANLTKTDSIAESSSRGPRFTDFAIKPDIGAPGTDIVAARAEGTLNDHAVDERYAKLTGTSMASPHVAGAAAILAQQHPDWTAPRLKSELMTTARKLDGLSPYDTGSGLVDLARATSQVVRTDTAAVSAGLLPWPHTEQQKVVEPVVYRNDGDTPVSLRLDAVATDDKGAPAPQGVFALSATTVVVPAHGTSEVVVTVDPTKGIGVFGGRLTATADGVSLVTTLGATVQEERHTLTVKATGRDGLPSANSIFLVVNRATGQNTAFVLGPDGTGSVTVPAGDLAVLGKLIEQTPDGPWYSPVSVTDTAGRVDLAKDATVVLDARQGKPISVDLPDNSVAPQARQTFLTVPLAPGKNSGLRGSVSGDTAYYGLPFGAPLDDLVYRTAMRAGKSRITLSVTAPEPTSVPVDFFESSPFLTGDHTYRVVDGKQGRPEDLEGVDVRGALVLLRLAPEESWNLVDRAAAVHAAGGAVVLQSGQVPFGGSEQTAVPVLTAAPYRTTRLAELLAAGGPVTVSLRGIDTSPVSYNLMFPEKGALPAGKTYQVRKPDLAEVKAVYRSAGADALMRHRVYPVFGDELEHGTVMDEWLRAPVERTEYYSAGAVSWYHEGFIGRMFGQDDRDPLAGAWSDQAIARYSPGHRYERVWNQAVIAPAFGSAPVTWSGSSVSRTDNRIDANLSIFSLGPGAAPLEAWIRSGYGTLSLSRDGQDLGTSYDARTGQWQVPSADGEYRLSLDASRWVTQTALSTQVKTTWGFRSAQGNAAAPPLLQVGYRVPLDIRNSAPAGIPLPVGLSATRQSESGKAALRELKAWVSYDDGATWTQAKTGPGGLAVIPRGGKPGGFASLRVTATDTAGNSVDQTVIRAYLLR
ncbi:MAG: S8 family serine peptidase [Umezawaea sp.]